VEQTLFKKKKKKKKKKKTQHSHAMNITKKKKMGVGVIDRGHKESVLRFMCSSKSYIFNQRVVKALMKG
jgi:hypothetical protein